MRIGGMEKGHPASGAMRGMLDITVGAHYPRGLVVTAL